MFIHIEEKRVLKLDDLPKTMGRRCIRPKAIIENVAHFYELSHLNTMWKQRLIESRELVGEQLGGVAKILEELATNINEKLEFDTDLEDEIYVALDKAGLPVKDVMVSNSAKGNLEIIVDKSPYFNNDICKNEYISIISKAVETKLVSKTCSQNIIENKEDYNLTLVESERYAALTRAAVAIKADSELSGIVTHF